MALASYFSFRPRSALSGLDPKPPLVTYAPGCLIVPCDFYLLIPVSLITPSPSFASHALGPRAIRTIIHSVTLAVSLSFVDVMSLLSFTPLNRSSVSRPQPPHEIIKHKVGRVYI